MKLNNSTYDRLKFFVLIVLPASAAFYLGLGQMWDFPETDKVGASIGLLAAFLGTLLQISNSQYKNDPDGYLTPTTIDPDTGIPGMALTVVKPPEQLLSGKEVVLKVGPAPRPPVRTELRDND